MARVEEKIHKLKYPGAVDADGHILESAKCWEEYCEAKYRAKAVRLKEDEDGLEYLEINGVPSRVNRGGNFGAVAQMGQVTRNSGQLRSADQIRRQGFRSARATPRIVSTDSTKKDSTPRSFIPASI